MCVCNLCTFWSTQLHRRSTRPPTTLFWYFEPSGSASGQVDNHRQPGFSHCQSTDLERPARWYDICWAIVYLLPVSHSSSLHEIIFWLFPGLTVSLSSWLSSSLHYLGYFENSGLTDDWLQWVGRVFARAAIPIRDPAAGADAAFHPVRRLRDWASSEMSLLPSPVIAVSCNSNPYSCAVCQCICLGLSVCMHAYVHTSLLVHCRWQGQLSLCSVAS